MDVGKSGESHGPVEPPLIVDGKMGIKFRALAARFDFVTDVAPGESAEGVERIIFFFDAAIPEMAIQKDRRSAAVASDFNDASRKIAGLIDTIAQKTELRGCEEIWIPRRNQSEQRRMIKQPAQETSRLHRTDTFSIPVRIFPGLSISRLGAIVIPSPGGAPQLSPAALELEPGLYSSCEQPRPMQQSHTDSARA